MQKAHLGRRPATLRSIVAFPLFVLRRLQADKLGSAIATLTYTSLLAIVPLLILVFAIMSSFPAFDTVRIQIEKTVFDAVVPETGAAMREYLSGFVQGANDLTTFGVVALALTALFLLATIESTLNQVWHVEHSRPILVRFLVFWAILTLGPLLIALSFALTSGLLNWMFGVMQGEFGLSSLPGPGNWPEPIKRTISLTINIVGFTALYYVVPARHVRLMDAAVGGSFAALSFEFLASWFDAFILSGETYQTIYGAVAAVPIFLVWIYSCWMVVVLGAVIAAALPDWRQPLGSDESALPEAAQRLNIALTLLARLYRQSQNGGTLAASELMDGLPAKYRDDILERLLGAGYLVEADDGGLALARDAHTTTVSDLVVDIGVALGLPSKSGQPIGDGLEGIHHLLSRLHGAEVEILGKPLAGFLDDHS